nr:MAG TPA: hypothetical protein [Caudoviricetes sp.]
MYFSYVFTGDLVTVAFYICLYIRLFAFAGA